MIAHIAVIVPAADEADHIRGCLDALAVARRHLTTVAAATVTSSVVVVLDSCGDTSPDIVAEYDWVDVVRIDARRVGAARRAGAEHVLTAKARDEAGLDALWMVNTDADSLVPHDWLARMVSLADAGADLILGTVVPGSGLPAHLEMAWHDLHDASDGHPHVHGANLGIRASTYLAAGGWAPLARQEDEDLVARVSADRSQRIHRSGQLPVVTSSRLQARAPQGFSRYLRDLTGSVSP